VVLNLVIFSDQVLYGFYPFLDFKFNLPMYNGEPNVKKLDNWIRQMEFYWYVQ
jgi:hypothetical protein